MAEDFATVVHALKECLQSKQTPSTAAKPWFDIPQPKNEMMKTTKTRRPTFNHVHRTRAVPRALLLAKPSHTKTITMPVRTMRMMTDAECGLPDDPVAQTAAETFIAAWIGWRMKQAEKAQAESAKVTAVEVPIDDASLSILDVPADVLDGISAELRRIAGLSGDGPGFSTYQS